AGGEDRTASRMARDSHRDQGRDSAQHRNRRYRSPRRGHGPGLLDQRWTQRLPRSEHRRADVDRCHLRRSPRLGIRPRLLADPSPDNPERTAMTDAANLDATTASEDTPRAIIKLEGVSKVYEGSDTPAVDSLDLEIL